MNQIQFVDLYQQYRNLKNEIDAVIEDVIRRSLFVRGPYVDEFESKFSRLIGSQHCVSCANGTDALYIAMRTFGLKEGDEVICPAHSWISTSETITQAGARVVFCDTDADTFTIDPAKIGGFSQLSTVGIIPVHLFGQPADMNPILEIASRYKLWVRGLRTSSSCNLQRPYSGNYGDAATFSFTRVKILVLWAMPGR